MGGRHCERTGGSTPSRSLGGVDGDGSAELSIDDLLSIDDRRERGKGGVCEPRDEEEEEGRGGVARRDLDSSRTLEDSARTTDGTISPPSTRSSQARTCLIFNADGD